LYGIPFDFIHLEWSNAYNFAIGGDLCYMLGKESISTRPFKDVFSMLEVYVHYSFSFNGISIDKGNTFSSLKFSGRFGGRHLRKTLVKNLTI
jgi:hypothetical protein